MIMADIKSLRISSSLTNSLLPFITLIKKLAFRMLTAGSGTEGLDVPCDPSAGRVDGTLIGCAVVGDRVAGEMVGTVGAGVSGAVDGAKVVTGCAVDGAKVTGCAVDGAKVVTGCAVDGAKVTGCAVDGAKVVTGCAVDGVGVDGETVGGSNGAPDITGAITGIVIGEIIGAMEGHDKDGLNMILSTGDAEGLSLMVTMFPDC
jgi:hypothetical protein